MNTEMQQKYMKLKSLFFPVNTQAIVYSIFAN